MHRCVWVIGLGAVIGAIAVIACDGGGSSSGYVLPDASTNVDEAGATLGEGGADGGTTTPAKGHGLVTVWDDGSLSAKFHDGDGGSETGLCPVLEDFGDCKLTKCGEEDAGSSSLNAGTITISGGNFTGSGLQATPNSSKSGEYSIEGDGSSAFFDSGDEITFKASGGVVPTFTTSVKAASKTLKITSPSTTGSATTLSRLSPMEVSWSAGGNTAGTIYFGLLSYATSKTIECLFQVSSGSGTIPTTALSKLSAGSAVGLANIYSAGTVRAGDYDITVHANASVLDGAGDTFFTHQFTLQ